jgi:uncharacterized glyoxalase superfamily protein PhnB
VNRLLAAALLLAIPAAAAPRPLPQPQTEAPTMTMKKLTPVLIVDEVEPCAAFWTERLGFAQTVEVPHGDRLGFVILAKDGVEIMYQSRASAAEDVTALADEPPYHSALFIEVGDLDAVERAMQGADIVSPRRTTFYGMMEVIVRDPAGNVVNFAQPTGGESGES